MNTSAYDFGFKLAAPWSALRTGLTHGAVSALPGAAIGAVKGWSGSPDEATTGQKAWRAAKGGLIGGTITGTLGGVGSGLLQRAHLRNLHNATDPGEIAKRMEALARQMGASPEEIQKLVSEGVSTTQKMFGNIVKDMGPTWLSSRKALMR